ncbi:hypothetical protein [uncultured Microbulbifer sp.]|uniref:hypothetical protein n=1 Tax=uncultured Microbulbifer sp. TaxID=348147 RepID=UPI0026334E8A|nr:hypothetical protein [uncultured Microbulbifer sp.]
MKIKQAHLSILLLGAVVLLVSYPNSIQANPDTKNRLDGVWCAIADESFMLYEHSTSALTLKKNQYCRTFKVFKVTKSGGGGRFMDTIKKPADIKHQLSAVEESKDGMTTGQDIGIFAFSKMGETTHIVTVDVSDESSGSFILDSKGIMHGFVEEVTSEPHNHEAHVGVVLFKKSPKPMPSQFNQEWEAIFDKTHKQQGQNN